LSYDENIGRGKGKGISRIIEVEEEKKSGRRENR
jgi:hypothetical protein